jgi:hypothetical protein
MRPHLTKRRNGARRPRLLAARTSPPLAADDQAIAESCRKQPENSCVGSVSIARRSAGPAAASMRLRFFPAPPGRRLLPARMALPRIRAGLHAAGGNDRRGHHRQLPQRRARGDRAEGRTASGAQADPGQRRQRQERQDGPHHVTGLGLRTTPRASRRPEGGRGPRSDKESCHETEHACRWPDRPDRPGGGRGLTRDRGGRGHRGGVAALVFAGIMTATAISGFCPLYLLFGRLSQRRKLA